MSTEVEFISEERRAYLLQQTQVGVVAFGNDHHDELGRFASASNGGRHKDVIAAEDKAHETAETIQRSPTIVGHEQAAAARSVLMKKIADFSRTKDQLDLQNRSAAVGLGKPADTRRLAAVNSGLALAAKHLNIVNSHAVSTHPILGTKAGLQALDVLRKADEAGIAPGEKIPYEVHKAHGILHDQKAAAAIPAAAGDGSKLFWGQQNARYADQVMGKLQQQIAGHERDKAAKEQAARDTVQKALELQKTAPLKERLGQTSLKELQVAHATLLAKTKSLPFAPGQDPGGHFKALTDARIAIASHEVDQKMGKYEADKNPLWIKAANEHIRKEDTSGLQASLDKGATAGRTLTNALADGLLGAAHLNLAINALPASLVSRATTGNWTGFHTQKELDGLANHFGRTGATLIAASAIGLLAGMARTPLLGGVAIGLSHTDVGRLGASIPGIAVAGGLLALAKGTKLAASVASSGLGAAVSLAKKAVGVIKDAHEAGVNAVTRHLEDERHHKNLEAASSLHANWPTLEDRVAKINPHAMRDAHEHFEKRLQENPNSNYAADNAKRAKFLLEKHMIDSSRLAKEKAARMLPKDHYQGFSADDENTDLTQEQIDAAAQDFATRLMQAFVTDYQQATNSAPVPLARRAELLGQTALGRTVTPV